MRLEALTPTRSEMPVRLSATLRRCLRLSLEQRICTCTCTSTSTDRTWRRTRRHRKFCLNFQGSCLTPSARANVPQGLHKAWSFHLHPPTSLASLWPVLPNTKNPLWPKQLHSTRGSGIQTLLLLRAVYTILATDQQPSHGQHGTASYAHARVATG